MEWLNQYSGALLVILTLVYTVATGALVYMNQKTIKEMQISRKQQIVPQVILEIDLVRKGIWCLILKNNGGSIAKNISVIFTEECANNIKLLKRDNEAILRSLASKNITLSPGQVLYYYICGLSDFAQLKETLIQGEISYSNIFEETTIEPFVLDVNAYEGVLMYGNHIDEVTSKLNEVTKAIKEIDKSISRLNDTIGG